jgi:hypothetical protein
MEATDTQPDDTPNLKDPVVAACLAWLLPGLGHLYQGRVAKAVLYFVCIVGLFAGGMYIGGGRVVYFSMRPEDQRLPYLCQVGVGIPALPALVQAQRFRSDQLRDDALARAREKKPRFLDWFMAPPQVNPDTSGPRGDVDDELDSIHFRLHRFFELGTVYTMIAGLLNVLAIYDAWGGPAVMHVEVKEETETEDEDEDEQRRKAS